MLITQKLLPLSSYGTTNRTIDWLVLEWYETNKRIQHKKTTSGTELALKFLQQNPGLTQNDVLYQDETTIIAIEIAVCDTIIVKPKSMYEMAAICYEIGNKHLPLFFEDAEVLVPFDLPLFILLRRAGYVVEEGKRKLTNPIKTSVLPHGRDGLFSKNTAIVSAGQ